MKKTIIESSPSNFDWNTHGIGCPSNKKKINQLVKQKYPESQVYCQEDYALAMYEKMMGYGIKYKDFEHGDITFVTNIRPAQETTAIFELDNGLLLKFDLSTEKRFCELYNIDPLQFNDLMMFDDIRSDFINNGIYVMLLGSAMTDVKGDLVKGHIYKMQQEFFQQIKEPTSAYIAKVKSLNKGGFIVDVSGVEAFLPGGLAAANKIIDFSEYQDKEIPVMIEDYLTDSETFVVSNKKYLHHILEQEIPKLDLTQLYTGHVTGTTKFGIFVEFDEIFTGLLHTSKMNKETLQKFKNREYKPGVEISVWIKEVTTKNKLILTEEDPNIILAAIEEFGNKNLGKIIQGTVVSTKHFGTLVKFDTDILGLIPKKELKYKKKSFELNDKIYVKIEEINRDKIFLSLTDES
jgi:predicted RNA-binding protein with RPS1 domain